MAENKTFKYLDNKQSQGPNAAQDFLNEKMSKNKYNDVSDPSNPYSYGEGTTPGGAAYEADLKVLNQDEIDAAKKAGSTYDTSGDYKSLDADFNDKFRDGRWGSGKYSKDQLAEKFGLDTSAKENKGDTAVWATDRSGKRVFLGNVDNSVRSNDEVIRAHLAQADDGENHHGDVPEQVSENGDVIGAMLNMWDGGAESKKNIPEPIKEKMKPIEHSAQIKQAKERVQNYEERHLSGEASESIFGNTRPSDEYSFDASKGMEGIGTSPVSASQGSAEKAASSFLDNKTFDVKKAFNIKVK